jgi:hypothetical protein
LHNSATKSDRPDEAAGSFDAAGVGKFFEGHGELVKGKAGASRQFVGVGRFAGERPMHRRG